MLLVMDSAADRSQLPRVCVCGGGGGNSYVDSGRGAYRISVACHTRSTWACTAIRGFIHHQSPTSETRPCGESAGRAQQQTDPTPGPGGGGGSLLKSRARYVEAVLNYFDGPFAVFLCCWVLLLLGCAHLCKPRGTTLCAGGPSPLMLGLQV